jgi:hypothetical protein
VGARFIVKIVLLQEETGEMPQRELSMEHAGEKAGDADASREEYVHVRAKRGQATNSHSLAERVIDLSNINGRSFCV